jgi:hypothetical protein
MLFIGIDGLRGAPAEGKRTSKPVAVACLLLAALLFYVAFAGLPALMSTFPDWKPLRIP